MYEVVMLRKRGSLRRGFYIKKFDTLEELANYIMSPDTDSKRFYSTRGLTRKEQWILNNKCLSMFLRKDA